ncbi:MAG: nicotinate (nicotinamide) nucleotide adenylyltransferase [Crocinitomicaceae bacterium]
MKVGLYFGSFNPIHVGHLIIASYMTEHSDLDQVWIVVSPQNPLKKKKTLLADYHRLALVRAAVEDNPKLIVSDIEFHLPMPSYTSTTLTYLKEKFPKNEFSLIMGEDNLRTFHKWFNHDVILENHTVYVYPRVLTIQELEAQKDDQTVKSNNFDEHKNVIFCHDAPLMKVSSSFIRKAIAEGKDVRYLLTEPVHKYVEEMHFYTK